jgi:NADP-dependent 3-hydroxy acid dehydrogenase YdfG
MLMRRLAGKTAVLTAAGQGIGLATALAFADAGATVWATDVNETSPSQLKAGRQEIRTRRLDVLSSKEIESLAAELGTVDVLFNCAGFVHHGTILDCVEEDWDFSFDLNVKSIYRVCRAFLPAMLEARGGSIINMASAASSNAYLEASSPRREQIKDHLRETGIDGAGAAQVAAHRTRDRKELLSPEEVSQRHRELAAQHGHQAVRIVAESRRHDLALVLSATETGRWKNG